MDIYVRVTTANELNITEPNIILLYILRSFYLNLYKKLNQNHAKIDDLKLITNTMTSKPNLIKMRCDTVNPENIIFKNMKPKMLYPMYRSYEKSLDSNKLSEKAEPIIVQTPYITLKEFPFYFKEPLKPALFLYHSDDETMSEEMDMIFKLFLRLDDYTKKNIASIIKLDARINNQVSYTECVKKKTMKDKTYSYIKFKLNLNLGEASENLGEKDKSLVPVIKIYYRSNFQNTQYKIHPLQEINKVLKPGKRVRFILSINKLWFNESTIGYGVKIMQMEIDNSLSEKFKMLKSLKNNESNMFDKTSQTSREKYEEYQERKIKYGSTKSQKNRENERIIKIINESNLSDRCLFNDKNDEYISCDPPSISI